MFGLYDIVSGSYHHKQPNLCQCFVYSSVNPFCILEVLRARDCRSSLIIRGNAVEEATISACCWNNRFAVVIQEEPVNKPTHCFRYEAP